MIHFHGVIWHPERTKDALGNTLRKAFTTKNAIMIKPWDKGKTLLANMEGVLQYIPEMEARILARRRRGPKWDRPNRPALPPRRRATEKLLAARRQQLENQHWYANEEMDDHDKANTGDSD